MNAGVRVKVVIVKPDNSTHHTT